MAKETRRKHAASFEAKAALSALADDKTLAELAQQFEVNALTKVGLLRSSTGNLNKHLNEGLLPMKTFSFFPFEFYV